MLYRICILFLLSSIITCSVFSQLKIAPIYGDHMVLQQQTRNVIWGTCDCNEVKIETSWGISVMATINEQKWVAYYETPGYGGPYEIKVTAGKNVQIFKDILIGEVWLASGQSNMQWTFSERIKDKDEVIKNSYNSSIRMINIPNDLSGKSLPKSVWKMATPENIKQFSAVGYFFAFNLESKLKVPIGIINSSWGGTRIEAWMSADTLKHFSSTKNEIDQVIRIGSYQKLSELHNVEEQAVRSNNEKYLNKKSHYVPTPLNDSIMWESIQLEDDEFKMPDYADQQWTTFSPIEKIDRDWSSYSIAFEELFPENEFGQGGVIWFRKIFEIEDIQHDIYLEYDGIDDLDWTYVNGHKIGQTLQCCGKRRYLIPHEILKKGKNLLAVKIIDFKGPGGFMGNVKLEMNNKVINLSSGEWKFRHHAFYLHPTLQLHSYSQQNLMHNFSELSKNLQSSSSIDDPNAAGILFEKMIEPLIPFNIKGVIWYQGESNVQNFNDYAALFPGLIENWRKKWENDFPFYYVQIAPYQYSEAQSSQGLREVQRESLKVRNTGMVVTLDIGEEKDIHPHNKQEVGSRLSQIALKNAYGYKNLSASGPTILRAIKQDKSIQLFFSKIDGKLMSKNNLSGFEVVGEDGTISNAQAKISRNRIRLTQYDVSQPIAVRYGWRNYFDATLFNKNGWPSSSFEIMLK